MLSSTFVFTFLAFLAVALTILGVYSFLADLFLRDRSRVGRRVDEEFRKKQRDRAKKGGLFKDLARTAAEAQGGEEAPGPRRRFEMLVEQSGLDTTPGRVIGIAVGAAIFLGTLTALLRSIWLAPFVALIGGLLPIMYVSMKHRRRLEKLQSQLPEAFDLMARVIRAGQTMAQALQAVADDFDKPISAEFSYCYEQQNLGLPPEVALRDLARRTGILEIKIFVLALLVQQQTGGNLAELLDKLATIMRDRFRIKGRIRVLTAEGRFQALVLLAMPPLLLLALFIINPEYGEVLFAHPLLLVGMGVAETLGALWIRQIVNFDF